MFSSIYKSALAMLLAAVTAVSAIAISASPADAHRYRRHHGGALAFGVTAAVLAGIALSRHHRHRHYRNYYYSDYDYYPGYYSYRRSYYRPYYSYGYYGGHRRHHGIYRGHRGMGLGFHRHHRRW